jgi:uncharacterized Zn-binding protein involved in type VI secretion
LNEHTPDGNPATFHLEKRMNDGVKSSGDIRSEIPKGQSAIPVPHSSEGPLTEGLADFFFVDGRPAALEGSTGKNQGDHDSPKVGDTLVKTDTRMRIVRGCPLMTIGGKPVATTASLVAVPCLMKPISDGRLETGNDFFFVDGKPLVRGEG